MKYMLLIYEDQAAYATVSEAQQAELFKGYFGFTDGLRASGHMISGAPLQPSYTATKVQVKDGKKITTDGPYAETKEQLGGFYIVNAKDIDEATDIASQVCKLHTWNNVVLEVRPIMELGG